MAHHAIIISMDDKSLSKRRFYGALSWVVVGIWVVFNSAISVSGIPFPILLVTVPAINIVIIISWFFVRMRYNTVNSQLKRRKNMALRPEEPKIPHYGKDGGEVYIPNITVSTELFEKISTKSGEGVFFDISISDYLKPGKTIVFHDEVDYGSLKKVKVLKVSTSKDGVESFFTGIR